MYELTAGLVKAKALGSTFVSKNVAALLVKDLLRDYKDVYLTLSHFSSKTPLTLRLKDAERFIVGLSSNPTVTDWLKGLGSTALPTTAGKPTVKQHNVLARDAWQAGYTATLCVPKGSPLNDAPDSDKTDIWLTRKDTDYLSIQKHCLATVNGFVHRLDADDDGAYIKDGGITFAKSRGASLGLLSFLDVGEVKTHSITPDMLYHPNITGRLQDSTYIKLPFDATGKIVGLVIAGYLHLVTKDVQLIGNGALKVKTNRLPLLDRYMEARQYMNLTALERFYEVSEEDKSIYDVSKFYGNDCIRELFSLSQSFLIEIATENLGVQAVTTQNTFLPGRFYHNEQPLWPLRTELGRLPSYLSFEEAGKYVLCIENNLYQRRVFNNIEHHDYPLIDEKRISAQPVYFHSGDLVRWSKEEVTISV